MTDFTIAGGSVEYRHTKPGTQYESTVPAVTLHFTVENGSDPEAVTARVMAMARNVVEGTLNGQVKPLPLVAGTSKRKAAVAEPPAVPETVETTYRANDVVSVRANGVASAWVAAPPETVEPPTVLRPEDRDDFMRAFEDTTPTKALVDLMTTANVPEPSVEDELAALAGEAEPATKKTLTEKDVEAALMSASSHLRKEGISVTVELGKLLAAIGCPGWKQLKAEQYGSFIDKLKGLHSLKRS